MARTVKVHLCLSVLVGLLMEGSVSDSSCYNAPGYWNSSYFWLSADPACRTKDLIGPPSAETPAVEPGAVRVLMFGDSNDRFIAHDQCMMVEPHSHGPTTIKHCQHGIVAVSWQAMVSVSATMVLVQLWLQQRLSTGLLDHTIFAGWGPSSWSLVGWRNRVPS